MRRGLASLIMGLSLLVASASWAGFVLAHTVLDPGRSERLADHLLDNEEVRSVIVDRMADALEAQVPSEIPVTRQSLELAASIALDDPRVEALVRDGIVRAHQNALAGVDEPVMLDATVVGQAGRDALVSQVPALDLVLPQAPQLDIEVPGAGLSWLGPVKTYVDRFTLLGALAALAGVSSAFLLARNRAAALRRVAYWAFASAAFWIGVGYVLPAIARTLMPSSAAIASAAVDVFFGAMIRPALILAGVGVALLLVSFVWPSFERRRPAAMLDRSGPGGGRGRRRAPVRSATPPRTGYPAAVPGPGPGPGPVAPYQTPPYPVPSHQVPSHQMAPHQPGPYQPAALGHPAPSYQEPYHPGPQGQPAPYPSGATPDPTMQYPVIVSRAEGATQILPPAGQPAGTGTHPVNHDPGAEPWLEGSGYVDPATGRPAGIPAGEPGIPRPDEDPTISAPVSWDRPAGR